MSKKEKKLLNRVKIKSLELRDNGQIPICLYNAIIDLNYESSVDSVKSLMELCDKYMRIKGFYFKYPDYDRSCKNELRMMGFRF